MKNNKTPPFPIILGLDLGTSGLRAALVESGQILAEFSMTMPLPERDQQRSQQSVDVWQTAFNNIMNQLQQAGWTQKIDAIIADATSSTVLICDRNGQATSLALMYDDKRAQSQAKKIAQIAPTDSAARGANSSLAKLMWLADHTAANTKYFIQHQIDWLNFQLCGVQNITDENNALKLGYDSIHQAWPQWVNELCPYELPKVVSAGSLLGHVSQKLVNQWQFKASTLVYAGTTDSIAAFLASGASQVGDAVTALGSTLAIKQLSNTPLFAAEYGIYSHKLKDKWLLGGASNAGGAVLLAHFSLEQLEQLIPQLNVEQTTGLACYPLSRPGERFPIADPNLEPIIPKTDSDAQLLQALIEGLVAVETQAYRKLESLGAPKLTRVYGVGGGTRNQAWCQLRALALPATIAKPISQSAAFGVTCLIDPTTIQGNTL
ncbi:MAG: FGGY-family carbohydrate kinase [Thiomicrospira sp.]|uniref:FGGY-family carbohydrate kinase n=1 Tax=Thiomicrospira sp. TaxID=935 RepID=UPI0019E5AA6E|nr:FGGY-family carbohydrate kinase [Thiomicrospira sp.]MBE0494619.1 FGGY-family carbohydrate kinase [Thiomicrospira sp.]